MFADQLLLRIARGLREFHGDNHDDLRFGRPPLRRDLRDRLRAKFGLTSSKRLARRLETLAPHLPGLGKTWQLLGDDASRELLVDLIAYRVLGHRHVRLSTHTPAYRQLVERLERSASPISDRIQTGFMDIVLHRRHLGEFGHDFEAYLCTAAIMAQFHLEQYAYPASEPPIRVEPGDLVIDAGACWGETSLYFASLAGPSGRVLSFEFVPSNLGILRRNLDLNPSLADRIEVIGHPIGSDDGGELHYQDRGPGSGVSTEPFAGADGTVRMKSIDSIVRERELPALSFIKMDIEGAETAALEGARESLRRFRPKLAISVYHDLSDFHTIPAFLDSLDLGYRFFLKHATIHAEETVLFAAPGP